MSAQRRSLFCQFRTPLGWLIALVWISLVCCSSASAKERLYPVALMNWMVEGTFHALIVDKSQQRLSVWRIRDGEPEVIESYQCSTGENAGDKWVRGDMKTPEGVYFFCSVIDGQRLPPKYGLWAFTTNYPNFVDRRRGKNGDGIWLHGRDKPLGPKPDSNGCIALENEDLIKVSRYLRLQSTPIIVVERVRMAPRAVVIEQERNLRNLVESWRKAWQSQNLSAYMAHYSPNFQSSWLDYRAWKDKKARLIKRYSQIRVRLGKVYLYRQNGLVTAIFTQSYQSDAYRAMGIKVLYLTDRPTYKIYAEDYHQMADDPFPVRTLLAQVTGEQPLEEDQRSEYQIRLVSTDEPERIKRGEIEAPRPAAPSRGFVLEKLTVCGTGAVAPPPIQMNEKAAKKDTLARLMVASLSPRPENVAVPMLNREPPARAAAPRKAKRNDVPLASKSGRGGRPAYNTPINEFDEDGNSSEDLAAVARVHEEKAKPVAVEASVGGAHRATNVDEKPVNLERARELLTNWKAAWEKKDLDSFIKMYHPEFRQGKLDLSKWRKTKKRFFKKYQVIRVEMAQVDLKEVKGGLEVRFLQIFRGDDYRDKGWKNMVLADSKGRGLRILSEGWRPASDPPADTKSESP